MSKNSGTNISQKNTRELFHRVFIESSRTSWPTEFRNSYIRDLAKIHSLSSRQLSPAILKKTEEEVLMTIEAYDKNFELFLSYYRIYESLGTKLIGMYHLRDLSQTDRQAILKPSHVKTYDFSPSSQWQVSSCTLDDRVAKLSLTKMAFQPVNATLKRSDFPNDNVWNIIKETATSVLHTGETLLGVKATITAEKRSVITIEINLDDNIIEIGNDVFQSDAEGRKLTAEERNTDRQKALKTLGDYLQLTGAGTQSLIDSLSDTKPVIGQKTEKALHKIQDEDILIVRVMGKYHAENKDEIKLSEDAEISMPNQKIDELIKNAKEFYDEKGTFEGFFVDYPEHNTDEGKYSQEMNTNAEIFIVRAYALIVRPMKDFEKNVYDGSMKNKTIDYITYLIDIQRGEVEIRNGNYSERAQRTFLDRIIQIDRQSRSGRSSKRKNN